MPGPLEGVRVLELGFWVAGPAAAGIMADWGADVIKLEPPAGDPMRGLFLHSLGGNLSINPPFELDNRGKRSVALNLQHAEGRALARQLVERADVFVTNLRMAALARVGLDATSARAINARLVYCAVSGYGNAGAEQDRPAYDIGVWWSRAGIAMSLVPPGSEPPQQRGGMGDHTTALARDQGRTDRADRRQRTGEGQLVSTSLLRSGAYVLGWDLTLRLRLGRLDPPYDRRNVPNPLVNCYRSGDDKWFWLLGLQADRHWPDLVRAVERPDLLRDLRFADIRARRQHGGACVAELDAVFARQPMAHWAAALDRAGMWWAPVQSVAEVLADPQARAGGVFTAVEVAEGSAEMVASPADFAGTAPGMPTMAPELGQHTEAVLLELGYDWEQIAALQESGAIGSS